MGLDWSKDKRRQQMKQVAASSTTSLQRKWRRQADSWLKSGRSTGRVPSEFQYDSWDEADAGVKKHQAPKTRGIPGITKAEADAIGLGYRVERLPDGTLVTIGRHSPWW